MNAGEILRSALSEIRHHALRSALTLLGIILGTLSITIMTCFLDGIVKAVWEGFSDLGYDGVVQVYDREARDPREAALFARSKGLQPEDAEIIMSRRQEVVAVAAVLYQDLVARRADVERTVRVIGATPAYPIVRGRSLASGRFFNDLEERTFARVCVLGRRLAARLFGSEDAVGKVVTLGSRAFRVIGVGTQLGNKFVNDGEMIEEMEGLYVPLATLRKLYTGEEAPLTFLAVKARNEESLGTLKAEVTASLKVAHHGAEDFKVANIAEEMLRQRKQVRQILTNWKIVLGAIAGISLMVGGIGLLSVMLISIGERYYEIGLRKAIGATDPQIFVQFLAESAILALLGGLLGTGGGVAISKALSGFFTAGLPIHPGGVLLSIGIALALGIGYGVYPALIASRMEPVEALRSSA